MSKLTIAEKIEIAEKLTERLHKDLKQYVITSRDFKVQLHANGITIGISDPKDPQRIFAFGSEVEIKKYMSWDEHDNKIFKWSLSMASMGGFTPYDCPASFNRALNGAACLEKWETVISLASQYSLQYEEQLYKQKD
jgi:hypothetical protein